MSSPEENLNKIVKMEAILKCFDFRRKPELEPSDSSLVSGFGKLFSDVQIESSNAAFSNSFSDAFVQYRLGWQVPLDWFWCDAIVDVVESYYVDKRLDPVGTGLNCLLKFLGDEKNMENLQKVTSVKTEAEIQAILAHHLFVHLAPSAEYMMDGNHWPSGKEKKCPACKSDLIFGNTSIGHNKVWYGFPDILVERTTVKIEMNHEEDTDEEDTEEYKWEEPASKKFKVEIGAGREGSDSVNIFTSIEVKKDSGFYSEKALRQVLAQTITNAFLQSKQNPELKKKCVPSFLISDANLRIIMYNVEHDRLYMSVDMSLWNSDGSLNVGTIFCLWLALNYENFQNHVEEDDLCAIGMEKSTFQAKLPTNILTIYKNDLMRSLPLKRKNNPSIKAFNVNQQLFMDCKYAQNVTKKMKSMMNNYYK